MSASQPVAAVSFDFFNTLVTHRQGLGRGALLTAYFRAQGWAADPWEHAALYDVFAANGHEFTPDATAESHRVFCTRVARTLFRRLRVQTDLAAAEAHAIELWRILGPAHLALFPEVQDVLRRLRGAGYRLLVVSNWQCGLDRFCQVLGLAPLMEAILASAEVGAAKPDSRIFAAACERLGLPPEQVLHVGDSEAEDVQGAHDAGLRALWLDRSPGAADGRRSVPTLRGVVAHLGLV